MASRADPSQPKRARSTALIRSFGARPRLLVAIVAGVIAALAAPEALQSGLHALVGWDIGVAVYLGLILVMASRATTDVIHRHATVETETRWAFLVLMASGALLSLFELLAPLHDARVAGGGVPLGLTVAAGTTLLLSWLFAHTMFAVHYAHGYYLDRAQGRPAGLTFPGDQGDPDYWDFLYFSFIVGMTCQTADVSVSARTWRRLVLAHGMLAFLFNAVVLALSINLLAGLL